MPSYFIEDFEYSVCLGFPALPAKIFDVRIADKLVIKIVVSGVEPFHAAEEFHGVILEQLRSCAVAQCGLLA